MQRDRAFSSYEDLEARYQRRPSAWVEPLGDWGAGRVELLQFGTPDETHDNIAAYWVPERLPQPGAADRLRLARALDAAMICQPPPLARVQQTRRGHGYLSAPLPRGQAAAARGLRRPAACRRCRDGAAVEAVVSGNANVRGCAPTPTRIRDAAAGASPSISSASTHGSRSNCGCSCAWQATLLTETWAYALAPE